MYKEGAKSHAKVAVGLAQADTGQLLGFVTPLHLTCQLMQSLSKRWGQMLTQDHHHAPHQVVVQDSEGQVKELGVQIGSHAWATQMHHPTILPPILLSLGLDLAPPGVRVIPGTRRQNLE